MVLRLLCMTVIATALLSVFSAGSQSAAAADPYQNYYVPPVQDGGVGAQLYPSPRPVPPRVGHTYITYQPLAPHEFLYRHTRAYYNFHPSGQITRTKIRWR